MFPFGIKIPDMPEETKEGNTDNNFLNVLLFSLTLSLSISSSHGSMLVRAYGDHLVKLIRRIGNRVKDLSGRAVFRNFVFVFLRLIPVLFVS